MPSQPRLSFIPSLCRLPAVLAAFLITQLAAVVYVLSLGPLTQFDWLQFAEHAFYNQWISLLSLIGLCLFQERLNRLSVVGTSVGCLGLVALAVAVTNSAAQWVSHAGRWSGLWLLRDIIIYQVLAGIALRYLYVSQMWRAEQSAKHSAQLAALSARMRPHFLFNTMNTIASLISYAPDQAEQAVEDLSALLRASLGSIDNLSIWSAELALTQCYCRIEQQRLGARLQCRWSVDAVPDKLRLPPLVLQPLLENAICHGIEKCPEGGVVSIRARRVDSLAGKMAQISIVNPCPGASAAARSTANKNNGIALDNIRLRLASLYRNPENGESRASLITRQQAQQFTALLTIPLEFESGAGVDA